MSPGSFSFTLTLPRDARWVGAVRDLCTHAGTYANLPAAETTAFCERVTQAVERAIRSGGPKACALAFDCADGHLSVTVGGEVVRQPLPA